MQDKYNPLESIATAIAFSPRDWSSHHRDAWIYGIVLGWDKEVLEELKNKHKWRDETVARLKFLHDEYKIKKNKNEELDRYRKALEEIEAEAMSIKHFNFGYDELEIGNDIVEYANTILDIIAKVQDSNVKKE